MPRLNADHWQHWDASGRLVLSGAVGPSLVRSIDAAVQEVESWADSDGPGLHHWEMTECGPRLARSEDFLPHDQVLAGFLTEGQIPEVLAELFGDQAVLFKEKINYKHPGGAGFAPHQDATAYRFVDRHISVMVPLDPATEQSGCLWFASERMDVIAPNEAGRIDPEWVQDQRWEPVISQPGDVVVFDSYAPHFSETNKTERSRRAMYLTYNAASAGDFRETYYADKRSLLDQIGPGSERVRISVNDDFLGRPVALG